MFPKASIKRFLNDKGFVEVERLDGKTSFEKLGNKMFLSDRAWEQRSETSSHEVERKFQKLANKIADGTVDTLCAEQSEIVTEMACIWLSRWYLKHNPSQEITLGMAPPEVLNAVVPEGCSSLDEFRDMAENAGFVASGPDEVIPGRMQSWPRFRKMKAQLQRQLKDHSWGLIRSQKAEFIVPDLSMDGILPVSPSVLLIAGKRDLTASCNDVADLNRRMRKGSKNWYFGRSLKTCPFPNA